MVTFTAMELSSMEKEANCHKGRIFSGEEGY